MIASKQSHPKATLDSSGNNRYYSSRGIGGNMSFERAIKTRKEELVTLTNALRAAERGKDKGRIDFLKSQIDFLSKTIADLEEKQKEYWRVPKVVN